MSLPLMPTTQEGLRERHEQLVKQLRMHEANIEDTRKALAFVTSEMKRVEEKIRYMANKAKLEGL